MHHASRDIIITPDRAVELVKAGGVVIFPTETFFGLGGRALDADATAKIFRIKKRSNMRPLPLIAGNKEQLDLVCRFHEEFLSLVCDFWPGPLTVVLPARLRVPEILTGGTGKVAVRVSSHPVCAGLALAAGEPLSASSANISGQAPVTRAVELDPELMRGVDGVLDAPPVPQGGEPSTLIEPLDDPRRIKILRHGAVSAAELTTAGFIIVPDGGSV